MQTNSNDMITLKLTLTLSNAAFILNSELSVKKFAAADL